MATTRDPNHVFVAMAKKDENLPSQTRTLWERLNTGETLGRWRFTRAHCLCFSTPKARNYLTHAALKTDASELLFIDADMHAGEEQIARILSHDVDAVGGLYPKKKVSLQQEWVANFKTNAKTRPDGLIECIDIGAGFFRVRLDAVEKLIDDSIEAAFLCEDEPWIGETMYALWTERIIWNDWRGQGKAWPRYLTEDFDFCYRLRSAGFTVWGDTICQVGHIGAVDFLDVMTTIQFLQGQTATDGAGAERPVNPLLPPNVR